MRQNIIVVSGALRSGSTLLKLILDNHSRISNPGEFDFLFDQIGDDGALPNIDSYKEWLAGERIFLAKELKLGQEKDVPALLRNFVAQLETADNILAINAHRGFHKIPAIFPDARYIHLLRDPRDVGLSSINMGWAGNAYFGIDHWIETEKSWDRLRPQLNDDQFIEVKYEELVTSQQDVLEKICAFLDLDVEQGMFDFFKTSSYGEINQKSLYRWKNELSAEENGAIEYKVFDLLKHKEYEIRSSMGNKPSALLLAKLVIADRFLKWKFGLARYGFRLFLMEKITRLLSLDGMNRSLRVEFNEINKKNLK